MELRFVLRLLVLLAPLIESRALAELLLPRSTAETAKATPSPVIVDSSGSWGGIDGNWSTFLLNVGTPTQTLEVLISTAGNQNVVIGSHGCDGLTDTNCEASRGGVFYSGNSSTFQSNTADLDTQSYDLTLESYMGNTSKANMGFDDITIGWIGGDGPAINNQTIAIINSTDFWLGSFGLRPLNSTFNGESVESCLQQLVNQSLIPSSSWAYTAGAYYRFSNVLGSLVLGGYDSSKFIANDLQFTFNSQSTRDLMVYIDTISASSTLQSSSPQPLLRSSIPMLLDSSAPYIWLPTITCAAFETAFGLTWNSTAELYLLNDTQHAALLALNPNVTLTIGNSTSNTQVDISLPYAAFDLEASYPLVETTTRYFPLKRANDSTQYVLGRTFFQEAYVIADYDRQNFKVSQVRWENSTRQDVVTITSPTKTNSTSGSGSSPAPGHVPAFPVKIIAGSAVAGVGGTSLIFGLLYYFFMVKPRRLLQAQLAASRAENATEMKELPNSSSGSEMDAASAFGGEKKTVISEAEAGNKFAIEADSKEVTIHEMAANEEVANEADHESPYHREPPPYSAPPREWSWAESSSALDLVDHRERILAEKRNALGVRSEDEKGSVAGEGSAATQVWRQGDGIMGRGGDGWDEVGDEEEAIDAGPANPQHWPSGSGVTGRGGDGWDEVEDEHARVVTPATSQHFQRGPDIADFNEKEGNSLGQSMTGTNGMQTWRRGDNGMGAGFNFDIEDESEDAIIPAVSQTPYRRQPGPPVGETSEKGGSALGENMPGTNGVQTWRRGDNGMGAGFAFDMEDESEDAITPAESQTPCRQPGPPIGETSEKGGGSLGENMLGTNGVQTWRRGEGGMGAGFAFDIEDESHDTITSAPSQRSQPQAEPPEGESSDKGGPMLGESMSGTNGMQTWRRDNDGMGAGFDFDISDEDEDEDEDASGEAIDAGPAPAEHWPQHEAEVMGRGDGWNGVEDDDDDEPSHRHPARRWQ